VRAPAEPRQSERDTQAIGALWKKLQQHGLAENTIIVFFNDNGQEAKGSIYQGGAASPSFVWKKGGWSCGPSSRALVSNIDFAPTILDLAGVEIPQNHFDGKSFKPVLENRSEKIHDSLYFELGFTRGVLKDQWKYVALRYPQNAEHVMDLRKQKAAAGKSPAGQGAQTQPGDAASKPPFGHIGGNNNEEKAIRLYPSYFEPDQLFDLSKDPKEQRNLAKDPAFTAKLEEMKRELTRHLAPLPGRFAELKPAR